MRRERSCDPIDHYIGERLRLARSMAGLSQKELGDKLDLSFQQVQKYEYAQNRLSSSKLFYTAKILNVREQFFFPSHNDCTNKKHLFQENRLLTFFNLLTPPKQKIILSLIQKMVEES